MSKYFKPEELRDTWSRFCEDHVENRWEEVAARIDEEAAGVITPVTKKRSRGRVVATVASVCAAAAVAVTVGLPLLGGGMAMLMSGNAAPDMEMETTDKNNSWLDGLGDNANAEDAAPDEDRDLVGNGGDEEKTDAVVDDSTTVDKEISEETVPNASEAPNDAHGGITYGHIYKSDRINGLDDYFYDWIEEHRGQDALGAYIAKKNQEIGGWWVTYCRTGTYSDAYEYVHVFHIPREEFERINQKSYDVYSQFGEWDIARHCYTAEEINDLYTLSRVEFNRKYAAEDAVVTDEGHIYAAMWFINHPIEDWRELGFTVDEVTNSLEWARHYNTGDDYYYARYMNRYRYKEEHLKTYADKIEAYKKLLAETPNP